MAEKGQGQDTPPAYPGHQGTVPDRTMPTTYNTPPPTYVQPQPSSVNTAFIVSMDGIFLIAEAVLSFIFFVCAAANGYFAAWGGGGWIIFVGVTTWIISSVLVVFHLLNIMEKMPSYMPLKEIELGYLGTSSVLIFISACIASSKWAFAPAVRACSMFCWFSLLVYGADTVRRFIEWRNAHTEGLPTTVSSATHTITTTTTHNTGANITTEPHY